MKLPAIPFLTKKVTTEFFLALIFESDKISAILFRDQAKILTIIATSSTKIELLESSVEDLVVVCDTVISKLEMSLPEDVNLEKTIFSVPYSWVTDGKIKPERLSQLKKISVELALVPMGFIVSIEAIVAFLQKKEGVPLNGIFVELAEKLLSIFIVRGGNIIDVLHGPVEESVELTAEKLLGQEEKLDVLPSKIILLNNEEAQDSQQKFLQHHWTRDLPFQHLPQVTMLDKGFENEAIIHGVASQMDATIKGDVAVSTFENDTVSDSEDLESGSFGFVKDEDIANIAPETSKKEDSSDEVDTPENLQEGKTEDNIDDYEKVDDKDFGFSNDEEEILEKKPKLSILASILSVIPKRISFPAFKNPKRFMKGPRSLLIPGAALVAVIILILLYYAVILKADVVVFTAQKAFNQDQMDITLSPTESSSFENKTLKISTVDEQVSGSEQQETTGQKDTGQKATGSITLFNKTSNPQTIQKGTTILSSNNLEFTLDDDVQIASTSSFATSFTSSNANVTASDFGKEYNLPSGTNFSVKGVDTSQVIGKNDNAFSGGSKEEIQVVSDKDLTDLQNTVLSRLFDKAGSQASSKLGSDDALIGSYIDANFTSKKFDSKSGDKANNVKLDATVDYTLGVYKKEELSNFLKSSNNFNVPSDFKLSNNESQIKISDISNDNGQISAKLSFNAVFKPEIDSQKLPQEIIGKSVASATQKLKSEPGVSDATIVFHHKLPFLPTFLPFNKANIDIEVKSST